MPDLKECPFCGSRHSTLEQLGTEEHPFFVVSCDECHADGPVAPSAEEGRRGLERSRQA
jgi:hypothetical protein